jgi:hypothetical protein
LRNITLSIEDDILRAGREYARIHNMSFNVLVRKLIEQTVVPRTDQWLEDTFTLMDKLNVSSANKKWSRDELFIHLI